MKTWRVATIGAVLAALAISGPAVAQPKSQARAKLVQDLADCRKITEDAARLACYDQTATSLEQAEAKGDIVVVDRDQARQVRRQAFGFSLPSISLFEKGETQEELQNVTGEVAVASVNGAGRWTIRLTDGAIWVQIDNNELHRTPKPGNPVKVRQAAMGSFIMSINNGGGFRVRRVE